MKDKIYLSFNQILSDFKSKSAWAKLGYEPRTEAKYYGTYPKKKLDYDLFHISQLMPKPKIWKSLLKEANFSPQRFTFVTALILRDKLFDLSSPSIDILTPIISTEKQKEFLNFPKVLKIMEAEKKEERSLRAIEAAKVKKEQKIIDDARKLIILKEKLQKIIEKNGILENKEEEQYLGLIKDPQKIPFNMKGLEITKCYLTRKKNDYHLYVKKIVPTSVSVDLLKKFIKSNPEEKEINKICKLTNINWNRL